MQRRIDRLERQRPEQAVIFLWGDKPLPAGVDESMLVIRFVWDDSKAAPGHLASQGQKRARRQKEVRQVGFNTRH